jgi:hypothetical protein
MPWTKLGVLLAAPPPLPWATSHAALPVVDPLDDGRVRIYFSTRDEASRSRIASVDVDLSSNNERQYRPDPVVDLGPLGAFDDSGVTTACLVRVGDRRYLYYSGWTTGVTVPFYFYIGGAVSEDEGCSWSRISPAPLLDRDSIDPYLTASPAVLVENGIWRMWYVSGTGWSVQDGRPQHRYHLKYAESSDGVNWRRTGRVGIDFHDKAEYAIARPSVIKDSDRYRMWFCARGTSYRIFYAESADGFTWERHDDPVIEASSDGWDAQMQAYPLVFDHSGRRHMLYNGNGYGATGIGHAVLEEGR